MRYSRNNTVYRPTKISSPVEEDSGHSSASNSPPAQCSPNSTINTKLSKNVEEFNKNINQLTKSSKILDETTLPSSDFDITSAIESGSSRCSSFSSESFSIINLQNDCIVKNETNINNVNKIIAHNANIINANASNINAHNFNNVNLVAVNLEKCIISK